ncbi:MAG: hypothetical protein LM590_05335 [Thermofilum sp.]|nr:hypothetical protein [Thermofilum sp.]
MGGSAARRLLLAAVILSIFMATIPLAHAQEGVSYYLGNVILIESRDRVYATAYIHPLGISWSDWRQKYFDPNPDDCYKGLLNWLVYMLNLKRPSIAGYGADDNQQIVYVTVLFSLSNSGYYNPDLDCLSILDVFKAQGAGFFDVLEVRSSLRIYGVEPAATSYDEYSARWVNTDYNAAPLWYRIYLSPLITVRVRVAGLPTGYSVSVYAGGKKLGDVASDSVREFRFKEGTYTLTVNPDTVSVSTGVRYRARSTSITVSSSTDVTFEYVKQVQVSFKESSGFSRVRVDGSWYSVPTQLWLDAGQHELYAEPSLVQQVSGDTRLAYGFSRWIVGGSSYYSNPFSIQLSEPVTVSAEYSVRREHRVSIKTRYATSIEGFYGEGESLRVVEPVERVEGDVKYVFAGWYSGGSLYSKNNEISLTITGPVSLESRWDRYYRVTVACKPEPACRAEEYWYREGSLLDTASFRVESVVYGGADARYVFQGWSTGKQVVSSPSTVYKLYKTQYRVRVEPGEGRAFVEEGEWVDEGSTATVRVESTRFGFPVQTVLTGFTAEGGSIEALDATQGWARVKVNAPTTVYVKWGKDYTPLYALLAVIAVVAVVSVVFLSKGGLPAPIGRVLATLRREEHAKPPTVQPEAAAPQAGTRVVSLEYLDGELARLGEEAKRYRDYLERLEAAKAEGKVTETAYEELKKEYTEKLAKLEEEIRELQEARKKLEEQKQA